MNSGTKLTIFKVSSHSTPGLISISLYSATADGGYKLLTLAVKLLTVDFNSCLVLWTAWLIAVSRSTFKFPACVLLLFLTVRNSCLSLFIRFFKTKILINNINIILIIINILILKSVNYVSQYEI